MILLSDFYQSVFGSKTYKLSLDAACTCPNRDGSKGKGGCIFCSENGSGDFAASRSLPIKMQVKEAKKLVESKLKGRGGKRKGKYIAYFQNFSSTYGDAKTLAKKYKEALECEGVEGIAIATRPDCLSEEILYEIAGISQNHFVQIELGLQTSNEQTGKLINRCYTNEDYICALKRIRLANPKIHVVTHLIFGLPGENEEDMMNSLKFLVSENKTFVFGIKITSLYIVQNTVLADIYQKGGKKDLQVKPLEKEEYFSRLKKALEFLPENCVIHRLTGDPPKKTLIAPQWPTDKKRILNEIRTLLAQKGCIH